jgi:hypothetical protein
VTGGAGAGAGAASEQGCPSFLPSGWLACPGRALLPSTLAGCRSAWLALRTDQVPLAGQWPMNVLGPETSEGVLAARSNVTFFLKQLSEEVVAHISDTDVEFRFLVMILLGHNLLSCRPGSCKSMCLGSVKSVLH